MAEGSKVFDSIAAFLTESPEWVRSWIGMSSGVAVQVLGLPEFIAYFFKGLPLEEFDNSFKFNHAWYNECKRELEKRRNRCIEKYWKTIEEYKEVCNTYDNCLDNFNTTPASYRLQYEAEYEKLINKREEDFEAWVEVDQAILQCGFTDLIDHENPKYYIEMIDNGLDPYAIPSQEEMEEEMEKEMTYTMVWDIYESEDE